MIISRTDNNSFRKISDNFKYKDFFCNCKICQNQIIDEELVEKLQKLRSNINKPILINSAYRCEKHNADVGGKKDSMHLQGKAVDIIVVGMKPWELAKEAIRVGFIALGVARGFLHVDTRKDKYRMWGYAGVNLDQVKLYLKEEIKTWNL